MLRRLTHTRFNARLTSLGGHVAIQVPDLDAVIVRLKAAGIPFSYALTFAIPNMRHIYVYDPAMNLIEINEVTAP